MILLINTLYDDGSYISDMIDDSLLPDVIRIFFESKPNGYHFTWTEQKDVAWVEDTGFDIAEYVEGAHLPSSMLGSNAKVDKIITVDL
jgi:hypothetical protein